MPNTTPSNDSLKELQDWGTERFKGVLPLDVLPILMPIIGDISRHLRERTLDREDFAKEWGNLLLTALRLMENLRLDVDECIRLAKRCQMDYKRNHP